MDINFSGLTFDVVKPNTTNFTSKIIIKNNNKTTIVIKLLLFVVKCSLVLTALEDLDNTITNALRFTPHKCTAGLQPVFHIKSGNKNKNNIPVFALINKLLFNFS